MMSEAETAQTQEGETVLLPPASTLHYQLFSNDKLPVTIHPSQKKPRIVPYFCSQKYKQNGDVFYK